MMRRGAIIAAVAAVGLVLGSGAVTGASASKKDPVVVETMPRSAVNTFFDITALYHQSIAQSMRVRSDQTWTSMTTSIYQVKLAKSPDVFVKLYRGGYDENWFTSYKENERYATGARFTIEVWRYDGKGRVPERFDLTDGFTRVHKSKAKRMIRVGQDLTLPFKKGVKVTKGDYVIVIGVRFADPLMFNMRFDGQENGTNTMAGYDHDVPTNCTYTPSRDLNPGGQAYRPIPRGTIDPRNPVRPFETEYEVVDTKVATSCNMDGVYGDDKGIWNPGDLRMVIRGRNG